MNRDTISATQALVVIPYFPGFFNSCLDDAIGSALEMDSEWYENENGINATAEEFTNAVYHVADWRKAHLMIACEWLARFKNLVYVDTGLALNLAFEEVRSPREYNFTSDRLFATIPADVLRAMRERVKPETWAEALTDHFESRPGFISFYPCKPEAYANKNAACFDHNEASVLLDAFLRDNLELPDSADGSVARYLEDQILDGMHEDGLFTDALWTAAPMGEVEARIEEARKEARKDAAL